MTDGWQWNTETVVLLIGAAIVLIPLLTGGGMMGGTGIMGGWMFLWPILLIGIIFIFVSSLGEGTTTEHRDQAMTILRERYARGELSEEEYEQRRRGLRSKD